MSTCPDKDIISVYFDGELPHQYREQIELHLESCDECRRLYRQYRALHTLAAADASALLFSDEKRQESFSRLQSRIKFRHVTEPQSTIRFSAVRHSIPALAAAAVFALILPIRLLQTSGHTDLPLQTAALQKQAALMQERGVVINGNVPHSTLYSLFTAKNAVSYTGANTAATVSAQNRTNAPLFQGGNRITGAEQQQLVKLLAEINSIDIFKPEFQEDNRNFTINIRLGTFTGAPQQTDFPTMPLYSASFQHQTDSLQ